jgi:DNA adenine methylase
LKFNKYIEPFLGSGAVFFHLQPKNALLTDKNKELIVTYEAIKRNWKKVYSELEIHQQKHSQKYYYLIRQSKFNSIYKTAARFIYLNRTCWNGLYRVNLKGDFNVPMGTKDKVLFENDNFDSIAELLANISLQNIDFESAIDTAEENDLIFIDPPYTVKHDNNGFIKYNENLFTWNDQVRLASSIIRADKRGVKIFLTNADNKSVKELYEDNFEILTVKRSSIISANSEFRGHCKELIIRSING